MLIMKNVKNELKIKKKTSIAGKEIISQRW